MKHLQTAALILTVALCGLMGFLGYVGALALAGDDAPLFQTATATRITLATPTLAATRSPEVVPETSGLQTAVSMVQDATQTQQVRELEIAQSNQALAAVRLTELGGTATGVAKTETAAPTAIPMTQTQRAAMGTQDAATATQWVIMISATPLAVAGEWEATNQAARATMMFALSFCMIVVGVYIIAQWRNSAEAAEITPMQDEALTDDEPEKPAVVVQTHTNSGNYLAVNLDDWTGIASKEQLLAVARGLLLERKTLAIAQWYGKDKVSGLDRPFSRSEIERFIQAIAVDGIGPEKRKLAYIHDGHATMNDDGRQYLNELLETFE
jgi:hypothetical protein